MMRDVRLALRLFRAHPGPSMLAVLTLALGVGAATAVFGVFDALFLRRLAVAEPNALVRAQLVTKDGRAHTAFSYPLLMDFREQVGAFSSVAGYGEGVATVRLGEYADRLSIECVTSEYFPLLGVQPALGRAFSRAEEESRAAVVVLSDALWRHAFDAAPDALGATIVLNGRAFTVIGVAPERFTGARQGSAPALWTPAPWLLAFLGMPDMVQQRGVGFLGVMARLAPGVAAAAAADEATAVAGRVEEHFGDSRIAVAPAPRGDDDRVQELAGPARLVAAAVGLLLLIACANVMHMLLARGEGRRREIAIRLALGGSRLRILRQFLVESLTLAMLAMAAGALMAAWTLDLLSQTAVLGSAGVQLDAAFDGRVLAASFAAALASTVIAGLLPAVRAARQSVLHSMRRASEGSGRWRAGRALAVAQVALSLLLLVTAGLFARSLSRLAGTETNLATDRVLVLQAQFGVDTAVDQLRAAPERMIASLVSLPGVASVAAATTLPVSSSGMRQRFEAGTTIPRMDGDVDVELQFVWPEFFETLGLPLVAGRTFTTSDEDTSPIVVNEAFARRYWPEGPATGRTFVQKSRDGDETFQIVGVARDTKYRDLRESGALVMYRPLGQFPTRSLALLVRTNEAPLALAGAVRRRLQEVEPSLTLWNVRTLQAHIDRSLELDRARTAALWVFAGLALLLVALGVYGIMAHAVSRRLREIGIRVALGARPRAVGTMVLRETAALVALGVLLGAAGVHAGGRLVAAQLHGVPPSDTVTLAASALLLLAVAMAASFVPAHRASRVDPVTVLPLD